MMAIEESFPDQCGTTEFKSASPMQAGITELSKRNGSCKASRSQYSGNGNNRTRACQHVMARLLHAILHFEIMNTLFVTTLGMTW